MIVGISRSQPCMVSKIVRDVRIFEKVANIPLKKPA